MAERRCRAQMRREVFCTLRMNAKSMIRRWEKEFNECAKMKRKRAHHNRDREMIKRNILQEVFDFIKGKDILQELFHLRSDDKENIPPLPIIDSPTRVMSRPPHDFIMDSLLEDMDSLLEPILVQDFDMDSLVEPITLDSLVEDMDSLLEPIVVEDKDSLLEPITFDSLVEDMDSLLEPIAFNNSSNADEFTEILCRLDSLLEPVVLVERC